MYRVLIADDEGIAIDSITYILEHTYGNKCELRTASTGRAVIEIAESFRPDIAIMDIQMPGINGIEAIREIQRFSPQTLFIVVTAYDRFDYAKQSIDLGVLAFMTKPLERDLLVEAVNNAISQIDADRERRSNNLKTWEKLEIVIPVIETGFVYSMLLQDSPLEEINQYRNLLEISESSGFIILIECGDSDENSNHETELHNPIGSGIRIQKYYSKIREILKDYSSRAIVGQIMMNKIPVFIPHIQSEPDYNERTEEIENCRQLILRLQQKTNSTFRIGIGSVKPMSEMKASYQEALRSLRIGNDLISHADDLPVACEYEDSYPIAIENELFDHLKKGEGAETEDAADRFFTWMEDTQLPANEESVRLKALEFVLWGEHIAYEEGGMGLYRFTDRREYMPYCQTAEISALHVWFTKHMKGAATKISGKNKDRSGSLTQGAIDYITSNYNKDLSLDDVSRAVDLSPYYFSKLFKDETGSTFVEYLTNFRIERAKELLSDPSNSVRDVCFAVGYQDPNYFSRIFKRILGLTPSEFRGNNN